MKIDLYVEDEATGEIVHVYETLPGDGRYLAPAQLVGSGGGDPASWLMECEAGNNIDGTAEVIVNVLGPELPLGEDESEEDGRARPCPATFCFTADEAEAFADLLRVGAAQLRSGEVVAMANDGS